MKTSLNGNVKQCMFLIEEMQKIKRLYEKMGNPCHELYTLMCAIASKESIPYSLDLHNEIMSEVYK